MTYFRALALSLIGLIIVFSLFKTKEGLERNKIEVYCEAH